MNMLLSLTDCPSSMHHHHGERFTTCEFSTAALTSHHNCLTVEGVRFNCLADIKVQIKLACSFTVWVAGRIWFLQCWGQRPMFPCCGQQSLPCDFPLSPCGPCYYPSVLYLSPPPSRKRGLHHASPRATVLLLSLLCSYSL